MGLRSDAACRANYVYETYCCKLRSAVLEFTWKCWKREIPWDLTFFKATSLTAGAFRDATQRIRVNISIPHGVMPQENRIVIIFRWIFSPADIQTVYFREASQIANRHGFILYGRAALTKHPVLEVLVYFVQRDKQCNCWSAIKHQTLGVVYQTRYIAVQTRAPAPVQRTSSASGWPGSPHVTQDSLKCFCWMSIMCTTLKRIGGGGW
jgi:hypothetical protein